MITTPFRKESMKCCHNSFSPLVGSAPAGGSFFFSSNHPPYLQWIVKNFQKHPIKVSSECPYYEGGVLMTDTLSPEVKSALSGITTDHFFTPEQFQKDIDYYRAQIITKALLDAELISLEEYHKLSELNAKSFSPFLVDIFPNTVDNTAVQR
jgi:hypothetical protein